METAPKTPKIRANSKMAFLVETYKSGITTIEGLALKMKEAEDTGKVTGLKKTDAEFVAKKDLAYYKKTVNWYLNQAKHKKLIDAPLSVRKKKALQETVVTAAATTETAPAAPASNDIIPTI